MCISFDNKAKGRDRINREKLGDTEQRARLSFRLFPLFWRLFFALSLPIKTRKLKAQLTLSTRHDMITLLRLFANEKNEETAPAY